MKYTAIVGLLVCMMLSQNLVCSARNSIRFNSVHDKSAFVSFMNIVKNKREMKQYFADARAQYLFENNIADAASVSVTKDVKVVQSEKAIAWMQAKNLKEKCHYLILQHPATITWKIETFIKK